MNGFEHISPYLNKFLCGFLLSTGVPLLIQKIVFTPELWLSFIILCVVIFLAWIGYLVAKINRAAKRAYQAKQLYQIEKAKVAKIEKMLGEAEKEVSDDKIH